MMVCLLTYHDISVKQDKETLTLDEFNLDAMPRFVAWHPNSLILNNLYSPSWRLSLVIAT
jgi:hypothetical protein